LSKELMKRCAECDEIKFGFAGFDIKENEDDEWVWICDSKECVRAFMRTLRSVDTRKPRWIERTTGVVDYGEAE